MSSLSFPPALQLADPQIETVSVESSFFLWTARSFLIAAVFLAALIAWSPSWLPLESWLLSLLQFDANYQEGLIHPSIRELQQALHRDLALIAVSCLLCLVTALFPRQIQKWVSATRTLEIAIWCACTAAIFVPLMNYGHEGDFSPVTALMQHPQDYPITGNRMLMVWLADFFRLVLPGSSNLRCYLLSQLLATAAATYIMGVWCQEIFGRPYRMIGQVLFALSMIPTIMYYTFYDIAMVFFYTLALLLLRRKQYALYPIVVALATLNHENALLLVFVSAAVLYRTAPVRVTLFVPMASLLLWISVRVTMQHFMPIHGHFEMHVWTNLLDLAGPSIALVKSFAILFFWWLVAVVGLRHADPFLQRAFVLLPLLIVVTFLVGKFIEARQWDAFAPVGIALALAALRPLLAGAPNTQLNYLQTE